MSAEQWVQFKSPKELERAVKFLGSIVGGMIVCGEAAVQVERKSKTSLRIGYPARFYRHELAQLVIRELSRRFVVTRIGMSAVGWYQDKDWAQSADEINCDYSKMYSSWAEWIQDWKPEFAAVVHGLGGLEPIRQFENRVIELFNNLDNMEKTRELPDSVPVR